MENISPGDRKPTPASKRTNGGCWCKIDNQEKFAI
jgi:hypothetical protein